MSKEYKMFHHENIQNKINADSADLNGPSADDTLMPRNVQNDKDYEFLFSESQEPDPIIVGRTVGGLDKINESTPIGVGTVGELANLAILNCDIEVYDSLFRESDEGEPVQVIDLTGIKKLKDLDEDLAADLDAKAVEFFASLQKQN